MKMKQLILIGLIALIEVNFISCKLWMPKIFDESDYDNSNEFEPYDESAEDSDQDNQIYPSNSEESFLIDEYPENNQDINIRRRRSVPSFPETALQRSKRQSNWYIDECTRAECRRRGDGWRAIEQCGPAFCTCSHGNAYLQGCGFNLVYHAEKRLCTWYYNVPGC